MIRVFVQSQVPSEFKEHEKRSTVHENQARQKQQRLTDLAGGLLHLLVCGKVAG